MKNTLKEALEKWKGTWTEEHLGRVSGSEIEHVVWGGGVKHSAKRQNKLHDEK